MNTKLLIVSCLTAFVVADSTIPIDNDTLPTNTTSSLDNLDTLAATGSLGSELNDDSMTSSAPAASPTTSSAQHHIVSTAALVVAGVCVFL